MACSSTKTIDEIDDLYEMVKIMEALDISSRGCKTLDELKTQVITTLNQSKTKPNWAAGQVRIRLNFYGWKGNFAFGEWFAMAFHQDMLYPQRMYTQWLVILAYFDRNGSYSSDKFAPILVPVPAFKMVFSEYRNLFFSYRWGGNCPYRPADNNWDFYWGNCLPVLDNSGNAEFNYDEIPAFVLCQMCSVLMQW